MGMAIIATIRRFWLLIVILVALSAITLAAGGDRPEFTYHANVTEVRMSFSAIDQNNHGVATLQAADFAVVDKGFVVRDFQSFVRSDCTKLQIAILVDASESVRPNFRKEIGQVLELISQTAGVPDENLAMFSFRDQKPALLCGGDCRASHVTDRLFPSHAGGFTPLYDTLVFAADYLAQRSEAHSQKVLILFSDGEDTISRSSLADVIEAAQASDIQIYSIVLAGSDSFGRGTLVLQNLADASGGRIFSARQGAVKAANAVLENFHASYVVTYQLPTRAGGFHLVRILPTHNMNLQFHSRSGYYFPARSQ